MRRFICSPSLFLFILFIYFFFFFLFFFFFFAFFFFVSFFCSLFICLLSFRRNAGCVCDCGHSCYLHIQVQSVLVISKSKTLWNTSRYPYRDVSDMTNWEGKKRKATFHKWICNLTHEVRDILKGLWERWKIASKEKFLLFPTIFGYLLLDFYVKTGTRFSLWDKRSFEISKVERTGVDCISHIRDINRQA